MWPKSPAMWPKLPATATKTKISLGILFVSLFFITLFSSYSTIRPNVYPKTGEEYDLKNPNVGNRPSTTQHKRGRLKTRDRKLSDDFDFTRLQSEIQRIRIAHVERTCQQYYKFRPNFNILKTPPYEIIVDDQHRLAYCFIPKIASTSWKRVWMVLTGLANSTDQYSQQEINGDITKFQFRHLNWYPPEKVAHILKNYTKFMFSRHPLSRVLSAFRNKLAPDSNFILREKWQRKLGTYIIRKYRPDNAHAQDTNYTREHYDLTFAEFVRYLSDVNEGNSKASIRSIMNKHWMEMYAQCLPCEIHYDFIGKYETLLDDSNYILKTEKVDDIVQFPSYNGSSPTNSSKSDTLVSYYATVPWKYIDDLMIRFSMDIEMFGYGPSSTIYQLPSRRTFMSWLRRTGS